MSLPARLVLDVVTLAVLTFAAIAGLVVAANGRPVAGTALTAFAILAIGVRLNLMRLRRKVQPRD